MHSNDKCSKLSSIYWSVWQNGWVFVYKLCGCSFQSCWNHLNFRCHACFQQHVPWHSGKYRVCDMIRTYKEMHRTNKYSQLSSITWSFRPNGWVFVYKLKSCGFESSSSHLKFRYRACLEQEVPSHLGKYRVWIHSEMHTWHKNIQSNAPSRLSTHNSAQAFGQFCLKVECLFKN